MTYALLFRTHVWNEFAQRSFDRLRARAVGGDVYVLADETNGVVQCPPEYKIRHTTEQFALMGLPAIPAGRVMWFNGDYPLYSAFEALPSYNYYIMVEYDVVSNVDFSEMIDSLESSGDDVITHAPMKSRLDWVWLETAAEIYEEVCGSINALFVISNRALLHLYEARLDLANRFASGEFSRWPYCEAFIASELYRAGFKFRQLRDFGSVSHFNWWPPSEEGYALRELGKEAFIHPVLSGEAYIRLLARYEVVDFVPVERSPDAWEREIEAMSQRAFAP